MHTFLCQYAGLSEAEAARLERDVPQLASTDVYQAGLTLLFFRSAGWSQQAIRERLIGLHPVLLTRSVHADILPMLRVLAASGASPADIRLIIWECAWILEGKKDVRRALRQLARLGMYNLAPASLAGSDCPWPQQACPEALATFEDRTLELLGVL